MTEPLPRLVGMVHLLPLPGSPGFRGSMDEILETAAADARLLAEAGFPALIVENFGDVPFLTDVVPPETIAAMTLAVAAVGETDVPIGVNVLRNDALAGLGVAAASGARFIRVNILTGMMNTDQGPIVGKAAAVMRKRSSIAPDVEVWADVMVKHSAPPPGMDARQAALDTVERGLADAVIVSGSGTGGEPDTTEVEAVREAVPEATRVVIGSGATPDNLGRLLEAADSVIVGSSIKIGGEANQRPDPSRLRRFIDEAAERGLV